MGRHLPNPNFESIWVRVNGPRADFLTLTSSIVAFHVSSWRRSHSLSPRFCAAANCCGSDVKSCCVNFRFEDRSSSTVIFGPLRRRSEVLRCRHNPVSVAVPTMGKPTRYTSAAREVSGKPSASMIAATNAGWASGPPVHATCSGRRDRILSDIGRRDIAMSRRSSRRAHLHALMA